MGFLRRGAISSPSLGRLDSPNFAALLRQIESAKQRVPEAEFDAVVQPVWKLS
jgi:hypothetical protein